LNIVITGLDPVMTMLPPENRFKQFIRRIDVDARVKHGHDGRT